MATRSPAPEGIERVRAIQRAMQRLATLPQAPEDTLQALVAGGMHPDDAREIAALPRERIGVYGGLVGGTVYGAVENQLAATSSRLAERGELRSLVRRFLDEDPPRSPYLRDVPFEFARWASVAWADNRDLPPFLSDLARFELLLFAVGAAERRLPPAAPPEPLDPARGVVFDGTVHLARFDYAVHVLPDDPADRSEPALRDVALLVYRDVNNDARRIELTPLAMAIVEALVERAPLGAAMERACRALAQPLDQAVIEGAAKVLADLAERGALLGPCPAGALAPDPAAGSPFRRWLATGKADRD
jgi:hypothetical protein